MGEKLINKIIKKMKYTSYLEIGLGSFETFNLVEIERKIGVDPYVSELTKDIFQITSDEYFRRSQEKFDLIYIDGLHTSHQVTLDIFNSMQCLTRHGMILIDDVSPATLDEAMPYPVNPDKWRGTVYKTFCEIRCLPSIGWSGVIRGGQGFIIPWKKGQPYYKDWNGEITFNHFLKIREQILPKIEVDNFIKLL